MVQAMQPQKMASGLKMDIETRKIILLRQPDTKVLMSLAVVMLICNLFVCTYYKKQILSLSGSCL